MSTVWSTVYSAQLDIKCKQRHKNISFAHTIAATQRQHYIRLRNKASSRCLRLPRWPTSAPTYPITMYTAPAAASRFATKRACSISLAPPNDLGLGRLRSKWRGAPVRPLSAEDRQSEACACGGTLFSLYMLACKIPQYRPRFTAPRS